MSKRAAQQVLFSSLLNVCTLLHSTRTFTCRCCWVNTICLGPSIRHWTHTHTHTHCVHPVQCLRPMELTLAWQFSYFWLHPFTFRSVRCIDTDNLTFSLHYVGFNCSSNNNNSNSHSRNIADSPQPRRKLLLQVCVLAKMVNKQTLT